MERFTINRFFTMVMLWSVFVMPASSAKSSEPDTLTFTVDQYQLRWLDAQMKASPGDVEIIFMHIPLPYGTSSENKTITEPTSLYSSKTTFYNLICVLEKNSSTRLIFAGQKHINSINQYIFPDNDKLTQVMTGAFGYDTANQRVIKLTKDNILISYSGRTETELVILTR